MSNERDNEKLLHDFKGRISSLLNVTEIIKAALTNGSGDQKFIALVDNAVNNLSTVWIEIKNRIEKK